MKKGIPLFLVIKVHLNIPILLLCLLLSVSVNCQDLENISSRTVDKLKSSPLKINGGISANSIFYSSNGRKSREPYTYFLQGNLNISWLTFSMPLSYSFSSQGSKSGYQNPFKFNRLSIHPKYKWIESHIGDVSMTFSPYTLSGHQFTGGGVELTPKGSFSISAMYGRLLKATEDDGEQQTIPAFERIGYGSKLEWKKAAYKIGVIGFYAKDDINSIAIISDDRNTRPKENLVISLDGEVSIAKNYILKAEYASTAITQDLRSEKTSKKGSGLAGLFFNNRGSTEFYDAFKASLDIQVDKMKVGIGYERIDPGYETLGAYFFNNDFENITLNVSRPLFNNKLNLSFNIGYQRDNLENQKTQATSRAVGAVNATLKATNKITITGSYSNFSTHTNKNFNQFDDINDSDLTDEDLEALNFKQLSQNATINVNWMLAEGEKNNQNINLNYSLASSANEENGIIRVGQANNFHNANAVYSIGFPKKELNISTSLNYNYSDVGRENSNAYGGGVDISKKFFKKKLNSTLGIIYNTNNNKDTKTDVLNFRFNASTIISEKHNFNVNAVQIFNHTTAQDLLNELTVTLGYVYTFDIGRRKKRAPKKEKPFSFFYKNHLFSGEHKDIRNKIISLIYSPEFKNTKNIEGVQIELSKLEKELRAKENKSDTTFKKAAINYLTFLYAQQNHLNTYHKLIFSSLKKLLKDAVILDNSLKNNYIKLLSIINKIEENGEDVPKLYARSLAIKEKKYKAHIWMQEQIKGISSQDIIADKGLLKEFRSAYVFKVFSLLEDKKSNSKKVELYLERQLADFYHKKSFKVKDINLFKDE